MERLNSLPRAPRPATFDAKMNPCSTFKMEHETPFLAQILVYLKVKGRIMPNIVGLEEHFSHALPTFLSYFNFKIKFEI